jgi:hypothetical protein
VSELPGLGPTFHECEHGQSGDQRLSSRYGVLAAVGGIALLVGILASFVWGVVAVIRGEPTWWVGAPVAVGALLFIVTALVATVLDETRKARLGR